METQALAKQAAKMPFVFDDFFKPWNEWFEKGGVWDRIMSVPAVNVTEANGDYEVSLAVPGMKKSDFKIDVNGNTLTISSAKEETKEEKEKKFTRKEYSYSSFSRTFTLPEEINKEKIEARYEDGILKISLPANEKAKKLPTTQIAVK